MRSLLFLSACLLGAACADEGDIRDRLDGLDADAALDATGDATPEASGDGTDANPSDGTVADSNPADGTSDATAPDTTTGDTTVADTADTNTPETADTSPPGDTTTPPWEVDPDAPWALGRPIAIAGTEGPADIGPVVATTGRFKGLVPVSVLSGAIVADGRSFVAPDAGGHAAIAALSGDLLAPSLGTLVYLDGALSAPERPQIAACADGFVYATINEQNGLAARFVRLSAALDTIDVATFTALPGVGNSVELGPPVCGGPGIAATLDAIGGAQFTAPDGKKAEFNPTQTENKTLILNGNRVFEENAAQVVSATGMRILSLIPGRDKVLFYLGEATIQRTIGETTLVPGDQLVYNHDFAVGSGGSIASQGWFGREDILQLVTALDGRFAVVWLDVSAGPNPGDPETIEVAVSVFEADGARAWSKRSSGWSIDRVAFDESGDLRVAGRFRSLEAIGIATTPVGPEDAFLVVLAAADGARRRFVTLGVPGLAASLVGPIFDAVGSGECADAGALDAVTVVTGPTRVAIGTGAVLRCATQGLTATDAALHMTLMADDATTAPDATDFWIGVTGAALGGSHGDPWPAGGARVGPVRARFVSPL